MSTRERSGYKGSVGAFPDDLMGNRSHSDFKIYTNIFSDRKLVSESVVANFATTVADGKTIKLIVVSFHATYEQKVKKQVEKEEKL